MCLEWMFCDCILVRFKLMRNMSWLKLGEGGTLDIPESIVCPKISLHGYPQGICELNGVSETIVHNAPEGVTKIRPRGHFSRVPASFGYFATAYSLIEALDFCMMVVDWGRWRLIKLVTHVAFDAAWLIGRTSTKYRAYTPDSCQF